jgi:hypothetical protein
VTFTDVDDSMTFQMPSTTELETYVIYVGFDEIGDKPERKPPAKSKQPARTQ